MAKGLLFRRGFRRAKGKAGNKGNSHGGQAPTFPLDGLTARGAWSLSRKLFTADSGDFYTLDGVTGNLEQVRDQTGNLRHLAQATDDNQPSLATAGGRNRAAARADSDGNADYFTCDIVSGHMTNAVSYNCMSFIINTYATDDVTTTNNDALWYDQGFAITGVFFRSTATTGIYHNNDGSANGELADLPAAGTAFVIETRHEGGSIFTRMNGGSWSAGTASGNLTAVNGAFRMFKCNGGSDIVFFEGVTFSVIPSSGTQDAIAADFKAWIGA